MSVHDLGLSPADAGEGVYGIDTDDPDADAWTGRYLMWATSPAHALHRLRAAGFDPRRTQASWDPTHLPPEGVPGDLGPSTPGWHRSRLEAQGWSAWQRLPDDASTGPTA